MFFAVYLFVCGCMFVCIILQSHRIVLHCHTGDRFGVSRGMSEDEGDFGLLFWFVCLFVFLPVLNACEAGGFVSLCHI